MGGRDGEERMRGSGRSTSCCRSRKQEDLSRGCDRSDLQGDQNEDESEILPFRGKLDARKRWPIPPKPLLLFLPPPPSSLLPGPPSSILDLLTPPSSSSCSAPWSIPSFPLLLTSCLPADLSSFRRSQPADDKVGSKGAGKRREERGSGRNVSSSDHTLGSQQSKVELCFLPSLLSPLSSLSSM
eukprot:766926-Hanusia_phi.AAC.5